MVPLSLRARLVVGLVALVLGGLVVADVATYALLRNSMMDRLDQQLQEGAQPAFGALFDLPGDRHGPAPGFPRGSYVARLNSDGDTVNESSLDCCPDYGSTLPITDRAQLPASLPVGQPFTVPDTGGVTEFRVFAQSDLRNRGSTLVLAVPLTELQSTLTTLVVLEATIGAVLVLAMIVLGTAVVRIGLRPLARMGDTAASIAGGDLSQRVGPATPRTEIGRLGLALNGMLSQIESAFAEQTRSEARLRRFIADASHELRTPLTSIRGYAELLRRGAQRSPEDSELARRRIEEESVRMSVLVDDMLLLARLDQGRPLERSAVDLQKIAGDARSDASAVAPARPITLVAPERVTVTGDEMRLRQVVSNLVRNALVHTPPATPIEIGVVRRDGRVVLSVTDHGPGLPADAEPRIFEPFFRADPGRSRDSGGSGLGLSIVAAVVAAHHGSVRTVATPGGGATFEVELPVAGEPAPTDLPASS